MASSPAPTVARNRISRCSLFALHHGDAFSFQMRADSRRSRSTRFPNGRAGEIRTLDPLHPMQVRYQTALRPEPWKGAEATGRVGVWQDLSPHLVRLPHLFCVRQCCQSAPGTGGDGDSGGLGTSIGSVGGPAPLLPQRCGEQSSPTAKESAARPPTHSLRRVDAGARPRRPRDAKASSPHPRVVDRQSGDASGRPPP